MSFSAWAWFFDGFIAQHFSGSFQHTRRALRVHVVALNMNSPVNKAGVAMLDASNMSRNLVKGFFKAALAKRFGHESPTAKASDTALLELPPRATGTRIIAAYLRAPNKRFVVLAIELPKALIHMSFK